MFLNIFELVTLLPAAGPVIISSCAFPSMSVPVTVKDTDDRLFELEIVTNEFRFDTLPELV